MIWMTPQMVYMTPPFKRLNWNVALGADYLCVQ